MAAPTLTLGLIGASLRTAAYLAGCVHSGRVARAWLWDSDETRGAQLAERYRLIRDIAERPEAILEEAEIAAVLVSGPVEARAQWAAAALAAGKHVILDAPPATSVAALEQLREQAATQARQILCLTPLWHAPAQEKLRAMWEEIAADEASLLSVTALAVGPYEGDEALLTAAYEALAALQPFIHGPFPLLGALAREASLAALWQAHTTPIQLSVVGSRGGEAQAWGERRLLLPEGYVLLRDNPEDEQPLLLALKEEYRFIRLKTPPDVYEYAAAHNMAALLDALKYERELKEEWAATREALAAWESLWPCLSAPSSATSAGGVPPTP